MGPPASLRVESAGRTCHTAWLWKGQWSMAGFPWKLPTRLVLQHPGEATPASGPPCVWPVVTDAPPDLFYRPVVRAVTF